MNRYRDAYGGGGGGGGGGMVVVVLAPRVENRSSAIISCSCSSCRESKLCNYF